MFALPKDNNNSDELFASPRPDEKSGHLSPFAKPNREGNTDCFGGNLRDGGLHLIPPQNRHLKTSKGKDKTSTFNYFRRCSFLIISFLGGFL